MPLLSHYQNLNLLPILLECIGVLGAPLSCGNNTICSTVANGCVCKPGYYDAEGGAAQCIDLDECNGGVTCPNPFTCINMPGAYGCTCPAGTVAVASGAAGCTAARIQVSFGGNCIDDCTSGMSPLSDRGFSLFGTAFPLFLISSNGCALAPLCACASVSCACKSFTPPDSKHKQLAFHPSLQHAVV